MKVLVIGGAGFLGVNVVRQLLRDPEVEVTVLDSLEPRLSATTAHLRDVWTRITLIRGSMNDLPVVSVAVQGQDLIVNCAAQTSHPLSLQDPLFDAQLNCLGNLQLLEAVRLLNPGAVIVYASSSTVIGRAMHDLVDEDHPERPLDIYSANKGVAEKYYRIYHRVHDLKTVVLRFANLYGPYGKGLPEFGFVNYFIHLAWADQTIPVFGAGAQTRNVMFVEDAAEILLLAAQEPRLVGETFFAVHDEHLAVREIAERIVEVFGRGRLAEAEWPEERRRIEIDRVRISGGRLHAITNWRPRYCFDEGLRRTKRVLEGNE
jgi:UDP-glucose 4-epimerase